MYFQNKQFFLVSQKLTFYDMQHFISVNKSEARIELIKRLKQSFFIAGLHDLCMSF